MKGQLSVCTAAPTFLSVTRVFGHQCVVCLLLFIVLIGLPLRFLCFAAQEATSNLRNEIKRLSDLRHAKPLQRFAVLPQAALVRVTKTPSTPVRVYCLDEDLAAPSRLQWVAFKYVHTMNQRFVTVGSGPPITFEEALAVRPDGTSILSVEATSVSNSYYLRFTSNSSTEVSIRFEHASVFGRVEGRLDEQNERDKKLLGFLNDPNLNPPNAPNLTQDKIWNAFARLSRLRILGFWPNDRPPDAVSSEVQDQVELAAQKRLGVSAEDLDRVLRETATKLSRDNPTPTYDRMYVVTIRPTNKGIVLVKGIAVSQVRLRGVWRSLEMEFFRKDSYLQYSDGYEIDVRPQPLTWAAPSRSRVTNGSGNGRGGGPPEPPIWVDLDAKDFVSVANKAATECSIEYCVSSEAPGKAGPMKQTSRVDQQLMVECNNFGFGLSTSGKVEVKVGPFSVEGP